MAEKGKVNTNNTGEERIRRTKMQALFGVQGIYGTRIQGADVNKTADTQSYFCYGRHEC